MGWWLNKTVTSPPKRSPVLPHRENESHISQLGTGSLLTLRCAGHVPALIPCRANNNYTRQLGPGTQACRMGICVESAPKWSSHHLLSFFFHSDNIVTNGFTLEFLDHWVNFRVISEGGNSLLSRDRLSSELFSFHSLPWLSRSPWVPSTQVSMP